MAANKFLYPLFNHWFRGGNIWLYSDPHFSDDEMKYIRKDYIGDEEQVKRINSKVGKNDTIIILGDIGNAEWVEKIRGYKILIMGNHDKGKSNYDKKDNNRLFDEVYEGPLMISDKVMLSHEPLRLPDNCIFNIHGHDHSNWFNHRSHLNFISAYSIISILLSSNRFSNYWNRHGAYLSGYPTYGTS